MNESGRSVGEAMRFYKLDLEPSSSFTTSSTSRRPRSGSRSAAATPGHNGLRSITAHVGNDYKRRPARHRPSRRQGAGAPLRARRFRQVGDGLGRRRSATRSPAPPRCWPKARTRASRTRSISPSKRRASPARTRRKSSEARRAPYSAASRSAWQRRSCARKGAGFSGLLSSATSARAAASRTSTLRSAVARIAGVRSPS